MIRNAEINDLPRILEIYEYARQFMAKHQNPTQWRDNYPPEELLRECIQKRQLYVVTEEAWIHGVFTFFIGEDDTYLVIRQGAWLSNTPYGAIHMVASDGQTHGLLSKIVEFCSKKMPHLRMDTHEDNHIMQHLITKNGFQKCGIISAHDGTPRIAYEKL